MTNKKLITAAKYFWVSMAILNVAAVCIIGLRGIELTQVELFSWPIPEVFILEIGLLITSLAVALVDGKEGRGV